MTNFDTRAREIAYAPAWYDGKTMEREFLADLISSALKEAVEEAKLQERSECAQKFEDYYNQWVGVDDNRANAGRDAASAICSRKETPDV